MANLSVGGARLDSEEDNDLNTPFYIRYTRLSKRPSKDAASASNPGHRTNASEKPIAAKQVDEEEQIREKSAQCHRKVAEAQLAEAGVECTPFGNGKGESKGRGGPVSMTLVDQDLLDCPICFQPLCSPVYQCENGHIACASCCTTILDNKCSNCCLPIGNIRCKAVEKILESVRVTCKYMPYGCAEMFSYSEKLAHEKACNYVPCSCPCICCDFVGISNHLPNHFALEHMDSSKRFWFNSLISISMDTTQKHVILREGREGELFVLNRCIETLGSFYNVVCVAPSASEKRFSYELTAFIGEDLVKASVEMMSKWTAQPPTKITSLFVPSNFTSAGQLLKLALVIRKNPAPAS